MGRPLAMGFWIVATLSTVASMAAVDIILPSVPILPSVFNATPATIQYAVAAFAVGSAFGLLILGSLADTFRRDRLLGWSLCVFGAVSAACACSDSAVYLTVMRFLQGVASSSVGVILPAMILQRPSGDVTALWTISLLGAAQALIPGLAPVVGLWLLWLGGWQTGFLLIAILSLVAGLATFCIRLPAVDEPDRHNSYLRLLGNRRFLTAATGHAVAVGAMISLALGRPAALEAVSADPGGAFVRLQVMLMVAFIIGAVLGAAMAFRLDAAKLVLLGSIVALVGAVPNTAYLMSGGENLSGMTVLWLPLAIGVGLRGGAGFLTALKAADGDETRASAILIFLGMAVTAGVTTISVPHVDSGPMAISVAVTALTVVAVLAALAGNNSVQHD